MYICLCHTHESVAEDKSENVHCHRVCIVVVIVNIVVNHLTVASPHMHTLTIVHRTHDMRMSGNRQTLTVVLGSHFVKVSQSYDNFQKTHKQTWTHIQRDHPINGSHA